MIATPIRTAGPSRRALVRTMAAAAAAGILCGPAAALGAGDGAARPRPGGGINVRAEGKGEPALLFVHGFGCALGDWRAEMDALSGSHRCIALDLPGHGKSAMPASPTIAALAEAVNRVKADAAARQIVLIGHSMGCRVITEAYRQSADRIAGLVYVDGSLLGGDPDAAVKKAKDAIDKVGMDAFSDRLFQDMFLPGADEKTKQAIIERALAVPAEFREKLFLDLVRWDAANGREALKQVKVPVLVLQSTYINTELKRAPLPQGQTTPWTEAVASLVPGAQIEIVSGPGHFSMIEAPQPISRAIGSFAKKTAKA